MLMTMLKFRIREKCLVNVNVESKVKAHVQVDVLCYGHGKVKVHAVVSRQVE